MKYLTPEQVYKQFGYHPKTTAEWADLGKIGCISLGDTGDIQSQPLSKQFQLNRNIIVKDVANQVHETQSKESINRYENRHFRD
ncbi:MAG: hypothetical protein ACK5RY_07960 [Dolichospermum sp.]|jgi:hypothetical protein